MLLWGFRQHKLLDIFIHSTQSQKEEKALFAETPACYSPYRRFRVVRRWITFVKSDDKVWLFFAGPASRLWAPPISTRAERRLMWRPSAPSSSTLDLRRTATPMKDTQRWDQGRRKKRKKGDEIKWKGQMRKCRDTKRRPSKQSDGKRRVYGERKWRIQAQQGKWTDKLMESLAVHRDGTWINTSQLAFKIVIDCRAIIILYFMEGGQLGFEPWRKLLSGAEENLTTTRCQDGVFNETSHHPSWGLPASFKSLL